MGCSLQLHVFDRKDNLPVDICIDFGKSSSQWPTIMKKAVEKGIKLTWHESEHSVRSVDGVRCWWTDAFDEFYALFNHVASEGYLEVDNRLQQVIANWRTEPDRHRFILELV